MNDDPIRRTQFKRPAWLDAKPDAISEHTIELGKAIRQFVPDGYDQVELDHDGPLRRECLERLADLAARARAALTSPEATTSSIRGAVGEVKHGVEMLRHWRGNARAEAAWLAHIERYADRLAALTGPEART